jgi:hypothetical protein
MAVVADFGLKGGGGSVDGEVPLARTREDMDLMNALPTWDEDLQENLAAGGFLFGVTQLLPGKVPVGVEPAGIAGGKKKATRAVALGKFAELFEGGWFGFFG